MSTIDFKAAAAIAPVTRLIKQDGYQITIAAHRCCDGWGYTTPEWSNDALDPKLIPTGEYPTAEAALDACEAYYAEKNAEYQRYIAGK